MTDELDKHLSEITGLPLHRIRRVIVYNWLIRFLGGGNPTETYTTILSVEQIFDSCNKVWNTDEKHRWLRPKNIIVEDLDTGKRITLR